MMMNISRIIEFIQFVAMLNRKEVGGHMTWMESLVGLVVGFGILKRISIELMRIHLPYILGIVAPVGVDPHQAGLQEPTADTYFGRVV